MGKVGVPFSPFFVYPFFPSFVAGVVVRLEGAEESGISSQVDELRIFLTGFTTFFHADIKGRKTSEEIECLN